MSHDPGVVRPDLMRRAVLAGITAFLTVAAVSRRSRSGEPGTLRISGTGMALATIGRVGDAYVAAQPGAMVSVLPSLGTSGGLAAVAGGAIDLSLAARPLTEAERAKGLFSLAYARTPVAFVTHPGVAMKDISMALVARIFSGAMMTWPDGSPIRLIQREPSDADWQMLRALSPDMAEAVRIALQRQGLLTVATDQDNADSLERVVGSFGVMSVGQMLAEGRRVTPLTFDGVPPTLEALSSETYKLSRTLHIVWRGQPGPDIVRFLAFLRSPAASELLVRLRHIPLADPGP